MLFFWDGEQFLSESSTKQTTIYVYEPNSYIPLAQIVRKDATDKKVYYYHTDQIGTPRELTSTDGQIVWRARYEAWGKMLTPGQQSNTESIHQPLRFQGQYYDDETGLHYNRYRYYDPDIGRFITQDPIGLSGGNNAYQYAPNPTGWVDPLGLVAGCVCRLLHESEIPYAQRGEKIPAANPGASNTPNDHILNGGRNSQFLSTGKNRGRIFDLYENNIAQNKPAEVINIDLSKIPEDQIFDVNEGTPLHEQLSKEAQKSAKLYSEVLIKGHIPAGSYRLSKITRGAKSVTCCSVQ